MTYYICDCCGELYSTPFEFCPRTECDGGIVMPVDELMVPIIRELLDKGYMITGSCSGHAYSARSIPQVHFNNWWVEDIGAETLESAFADLPDHWKLNVAHFKDEEQHETVHVSLTADTPEGKNELENHYYILEVNLALLDFVQKLPVLDVAYED